MGSYKKTALLTRLSESLYSLLTPKDVQFIKLRLINSRVLLEEFKLPHVFFVLYFQALKGLFYALFFFDGFSQFKRLERVLSLTGLILFLQIARSNQVDFG